MVALWKFHITTHPTLSSNNLTKVSTSAWQYSKCSLYKLKFSILNDIEVYEESIHRITKSLIADLISKPVRKVELYTKVCTVNAHSYFYSENYRQVISWLSVQFQLLLWLDSSSEHSIQSPSQGPKSQKPIKF